MSRRLGVVLTSAALLLAPVPAFADSGDDFEPPQIAVSTPPGVVNGWSAAPFSATVRVTDTGGSGVMSAEWWLAGATEGSGIINGTTATDIAITGSGRTTLSVAASDREGNESSADRELGVDTVAPSIVLGPELTNLDDSNVAPGTTVTADYTCSDADSGVVACDARVAAGSPLSTDGAHELVITARDGVGRTSQRTVSWNVDALPWTLHGVLRLNAIPVRVDVPATIFPADFSPLPDSVSYQWYRDDAQIPGATGTTYLPVAADAGHQLSFTARPHKNGYAETTFTSMKWNVAAPVMVHQGQDPQLTGIRRVGQTLTVSAPTTFTPAASGVSYQWLRNGVPIDGATGTSHLLTPADVNRVVGVRITATTASAGYQPWVFETGTLAAPVSPGELALLGTTGIHGTAQVGRTLVAVVPVFSPIATVGYQWLRNGTEIPGAVRSTYLVGAADAAARLSVRVRATASGYLPASQTSDPTAAVARTTSIAKATGKAMSGRRVSVTVQVKAVGATATGPVTLTRGTRVVARGQLRNGKVVFTLRQQPRGKQVYKVRYLGSSAVAASGTKVTVRVR
ncbi:hypothetical protein EFK50_19765 [Nocardioides marmoriginsengisoli]|uniref:Bacterial Ig-like domain-containing protein n=1 Tax=Nocardioides marmoriginsengisoli TaxID=661483 RepID=A0A3N0CAR8_9ACTN|nr:Ig-like domain repeat protein [Nocardioides marmoriginsengisoli]RNL60557.1 hypothetical protein EFK50_19765 [Nocardioides marmoriginsengisoli]